MAKIYSAPLTVGPPPDITIEPWSAYEKAETEYIEKIVELAKKNGTSPLLGEIYRVPRGDGYAQYVVWRTSPLELIWLDTGDAWTMSDAEGRGTRLSDIKRQVEFRKRRASRSSPIASHREPSAT